MTKYAKFDPNTKISIEVIRSDDAALDAANGWVQIPADLESSDRFRLSSKGTVITFSEEDLSKENNNIRKDNFMKALRDKRDMLLTQSDWTEYPDVTATKPGDWVLAWREYRQALRDFPGNYDITKSDLVLENVVWPTPPE